MTDRELMQQALDALEWCYDVTEWPANGKSAQDKAIEALRARLAQPEQKHSEQWWRHEVSNAYANGYEKGRASVKQPEQEPVAWIYSHKGQKSVSMNYVAGVRAIPLYTAPPQRDEAPAKAVKWQGLTQEDKREIIDETEPEDRGYVMALVEAKLKEKNHAI